jgi:hypothetical protein
VQYTIKMDLGGTIYVPSFVKIGVGFLAALRLWLRDFKGCSVGINDL